MTIVEFCESEDVTESAFYYWQRQIKRRDASAPPQETAPVRQPGLAPVQLVEDRNCVAAVEVVATNGFVIRVSEEATTEHVRRVLQAVGELQVDAC